jgi:cytochrome c oxidase subunit II
MGSIGKIAFIAILGLGAITGVVVFYVFGDAAPVPGEIESIYRQDLPGSEGSTSPTSASTPDKANATSTNATSTNATSTNATSTNATSTNATSGTSEVQASLTIPEGASVQGNPAYDPDPLTVTKGDVIGVSNKDTAPHTATSGTGAQDPKSGDEFDTSIIDPGASAQIDTASLNPGDHPFYCQVHPYMLGTLKVQ